VAEHLADFVRLGVDTLLRPAQPGRGYGKTQLLLLPDGSPDH